MKEFSSIFYETHLNESLFKKKKNLTYDLSDRKEVFDKMVSIIKSKLTPLFKSKGDITNKTHDKEMYNAWINGDDNEIILYYAEYNTICKGMSQDEEMEKVWDPLSDIIDAINDQMTKDNYSVEQGDTGQDISICLVQKQTVKEFSSIFYENTILNDGTVLEGANWDATKGAHIYKKKMRALKKELKQNVKAGKDKEAIKNISDMEKEIKNFKSEMKIVKDDQTTGEIWIGLLIYTLELLPATILTLPLGGIGSYVIAYKDVVKLQKRVDEDIKAAGGPTKYAGKAENMNIYIGKLRGALDKYEDCLKKVKRILKKRGSLKESSIMNFELI